MSELYSIAAFKNGDKHAFNQIFNLYYKRLCFFASGIINEENTEDVVQESFIKLWERRDKFEDLRSVKAFLYLTTKNTCINHYHHQHVVLQFEAKTSPSIDEPNMMQRLIEAEVLNEVQQAVQQLPKNCRKIICLSYFDGMSNQETADHLKISINTVKTQKVRSLRILRALLKHAPASILVLLKLLVAHF